MLVASKEQIVSKMMGNRLSLSQFGVHRFGLFGSFVKNEQMLTYSLNLSPAGNPLTTL